MIKLCACLLVEVVITSAYVLLLKVYAQAMDGKGITFLALGLSGFFTLLLSLFPVIRKSDQGDTDGSQTRFVVWVAAWAALCLLGDALLSSAFQAGAATASSSLVSRLVRAITLGVLGWMLFGDSCQRFQWIGIILSFAAVVAIAFTVPSGPQKGQMPWWLWFAALGAFVSSIKMLVHRQLRSLASDRKLLFYQGLLLTITGLGIAAADYDLQSIPNSFWVFGLVFAALSPLGVLARQKVYQMQFPSVAHDACLFVASLMVFFVIDALLGESSLGLHATLVITALSGASACLMLWRARAPEQSSI